MDRRDLLKATAGLAAGSGWLTQISRAADSPPSEPHRSATTRPSESRPDEMRKGDILYRKLGRTNEWVSVLGVGGFHIGMLKELPQSIKLMRTAVDSGVTFMDNCWDYHDGKSEEWMGHALRDGYRDKVFLMTKIDGRTKESAARQIDESLIRLQTDRIDLMQIHENIRMEDADRCFAKEGAIEALEAAKKAGKIRYVGFTGHKDPLVHNRMLDVAARHKYQFASAQVPINVLDASFRSFLHDLVPRLVKEGIALIGMKPMASGAIVKNKIATPEECLTFALSMPTSVVISGMDNMQVLEQNLDIVRRFKPLDAGSMATLVDRVRGAAQTGEFERFKTSIEFDGTAKHPEWMG